MKEWSTTDKVVIIRWLITNSDALRRAGEEIADSLEAFRALKDTPAAERLSSLPDDANDPLGRRIAGIIDTTGAASLAVSAALRPLSELLRIFSQDAEAVALYREQTGAELPIEEVPGAM